MGSHRVPEGHRRAGFGFHLISWNTALRPSRESHNRGEIESVEGVTATGSLGNTNKAAFSHIPCQHPGTTYTERGSRAMEPGSPLRYNPRRTGRPGSEPKAQKQSSRWKPKLLPLSAERGDSPTSHGRKIGRDRPQLQLPSEHDVEAHDMSERFDEAPASPAQNCVLCSKPLTQGGEFCPFCGAKIIPYSTAAAIDTYVEDKINQEVASRLKDQSSLVREIGDKAEDIVWKRLKCYGVLSGIIITCILGFIAFAGIKTLDDVSRKIEPIVSAAEQRAEVAKRTIEETATKVDSVKASLDQLSRDVEAQTNRVAKKGGEISQKLESLDATANEAKKRGELYQARAEEVSRNLEAMAKGLENRVEQVSKQVDNVSIQRAYPTLGQQFFVTYNGKRWKGKAEKGPNEGWLDIYIHPLALAEISPDQLEKLMADVKRYDLTPLLGQFGVDGPYSSSFAALGDSSGSTVFYFEKESEQAAMTICAIASEDLSIKDLKPKFVDRSAFRRDDMRGFVIEQSGLDLQLFVFHTAADQ
jgi:hypothetical protein